MHRGAFEGLLRGDAFPGAPRRGDDVAVVHACLTAQRLMLRLFRSLDLAPLKEPGLCAGGPNVGQVIPLCIHHAVRWQTVERVTAKVPLNTGASAISDAVIRSGASEAIRATTWSVFAKAAL